jgi:hypothetical protein
LDGGARVRSRPRGYFTVLVLATHGTFGSTYSDHHRALSPVVTNEWSFFQSGLCLCVRRILVALIVAPVVCSMVKSSHHPRRPPTKHLFSYYIFFFRYVKTDMTELYTSKNETNRPTMKY